MSRPPTLRSAAAAFVFTIAAFAAIPAAAQTAPAPKATESAYANMLRTFNPRLSLQKARTYARSVMADAWRTHLDPRFIMSIVTVESRWRANAVSRVGALGLGQLMPGTAARLGVNPRNPSDNLRGTSSYLKSLMSHFAGRPNAVKLAIAGYNAGPRAVERYHGIPPYGETQTYVVRVLHVWKQISARVAASTPPGKWVAKVHPLPDERHWLSNLPEAPAAAAAATPVEATPAPLPVGPAGGDEALATSTGTTQPK